MNPATILAHLINYTEFAIFALQIKCFQNYGTL